MSYGALGDTYRSFDDHRKSAESFEKGVLTLRRWYLIFPDALKELFGKLVKDYLSACEKINVKPDKSIIEEVIDST